MTTITYTRVRRGKVETVTRSKNAHGETRTPLHNVWKCMRERCSNPRANNYRWYGGRGIYVCDEWQTDYLSFAAWARSHGYENGMELDRIDNDGPYNPDNCRWVTKLTNLANRRGYLPEHIDTALRLRAAAENRSVESVIRDAIVAFVAGEVSK